MSSIIFLSLLASLVMPGFCFAQQNNNIQPPWPVQEWPRETLENSGFQVSKFSKFIEFAFKPPSQFTTDSIVVVKNGHLVYEKHANGFTGDQRHGLWSMTKTTQNALIGILEHKGLLNRDDEVRKYFPAIKDYGDQKVTISHLLRMSSGLDWVEENKKDILKSDPLKFYFKEFFRDMAEYVSKRFIVHAPGKHFSYSTGDSTLLAATIRGAIGEKNYPDFHWLELFDKLGMSSVTIERDPSGLLGTQGLAFASPRDIAKFGLLYLRDGNVNGEKLWPSDWLDYTSTLVPAQMGPPDLNTEDLNAQNDQSYGAHIWLNKKRFQDKTLPYPELPQNALLALGLRGQFILILPDEDTILVRTGSDSQLVHSNRKKFRKDLFRLFYDSMEKSK